MMKLHYWLASLAKRISLLFGLLTFLTLCSIQALPASAEANVPQTFPPAYVRIIQASPDVGTVDVFVDGTKLLGNSAFATVTNYMQLPAGRHKVQIALIGKGPGAAVITQALEVQAGLAYTVAAIGRNATGLTLAVFADDNRIASGMAKVRVYHLAPTVGVVIVASGGTPIVSGLAYSYASSYLSLPAGSYTFTVSATEPTTSIPVAASLKPNTVTSLFALSAGNENPQLQVVSAEVEGVPALAGTGSDPSARLAPSQPFPLLTPWIVLVLALGGMSAGLAAYCLLVARRQEIVSLTSSVTLCHHCSKREGEDQPRPYRMTRGQWISKHRQGEDQPGPYRKRALWLVVAGFALIAALVLPGCSQQSSSSHKVRPLHSSTARLLIPAIGVNAVIEPIGVLPDGTLAIPTQDPWNDVGWYNAGPRPGEQGSAVISGHLDRPGGSPAVFWHLGTLHIGDTVIVVDAQGKTLHFHVIRFMFYAPQAAPVQDIFGNTAGNYLNLMTCAGVWIPSEHQTSLRLVVYTSLN